MTVTRVQRLDALTGIRIFAALAVFLSHLPVLPGAPEVLATFGLSGYNGVTLFFILSGFILAWNYEPMLGEKVTGAGLRSFYVARFARIYPLYLLALLVVVLPTIDSVAALAALVTDGGFWLHVFALQPWHPDLALAFGFNGPGWSIGVEAFMYATFPLLLIATRRLRGSVTGVLWLAAGAVVVTFVLALVFALTAGGLPIDDPASAHRWLYRTPLTRLPDFVLGIALAGLVRLTRDRSFARAGTLLQVGGVVAAVTLMALPALYRSAWSWDAAYVVPFGALLLGLAWAPDSLFARALSTRPFVFLGEASYAFYLFHVPVLTLWSAAYTGSLFSWLTVYSTALVVVLLVAAGAHVLVERPARTGIRRLLDRRRPTGLSTELPLDDAEDAAKRPAVSG